MSTEWKGRVTHKHKNLSSLFLYNIRTTVHIKVPRINEYYYKKFVNHSAILTPAFLKVSALHIAIIMISIHNKAENLDN